MKALIPNGVMFVWIGFFGIVLHHFQYAQFSPEGSGEIAGAILFTGLVILTVHLVHEQNKIK